MKYAQNENVNQGLSVKKFFYKYSPAMLVFVLMGALSQPLIAYAYTLLDANNAQVILEKILPIILTGLVFSSLSHIFKTYFSNKILNLLRKNIFNKILDNTLSKFHMLDSGDYYNLLSKKIELWQKRYYDEFWEIIQNVIEIFLVFSLIFCISHYCFIICALFLIPLIINNFIFPKKIDKEYNVFVKTIDEMTVAIKEFFNGFDIIKINHLESVFSNKFSHFSDRSNRYEQRVGFMCNISGTVANVCVVLSQITGLFFGFMLYFHQKILLGKFIALMQLTFFLNEPVIKLINSIISFNSNTKINNEITDVLSIKKHKTADRIKVTTIGFDKLSYKYPDTNKYVINDFSLQFQKGKKYLIIGESGSGKTTFLKLILGMIKPTSGNIYYNQNSKIDDPVSAGLICLVPQDIFVFNDTIKNNIDLLDEYSQDEIEKVVDIVQLRSLVNSREHSINGLIGDEIFQISGGEKARLALARVMLNKAPILLIDEILASLDPDISFEIEKLILSIKNKIVIHVSHKSSKELKNKYDAIIDLS
jgi:ABC-type multidrug transport system fused ATPase/permease subunit